MSALVDGAGAIEGIGVRVRGAVKRYRGVTALAGIDLDLGPGRFAVLLGPSGSGKSTMARCLAGVEHLDGGTVHLGDRLVSDGRRHLPPDRRNLAMVFQDYALWPHLTALGNVTYALRRLRLPRADARRSGLAALERVGLARHADRYPHELSGGEQQRVALARAVVARPGLLLFDEPLSNLDADLRERLRVEIATVARESGATVVYITHDQAEAFALADEIAVLDGGRIVQCGPPEEIYGQPATPFVARFTGLSGELRGQVCKRVDGEVVVRVPGGLVAARARPITVGDDVLVAVRPAATRLVQRGEDGAGSLSGVVIDVAYRGRGYDHVVRTSAGVLGAVFAPQRYERGCSVAVEVDPAGCVAFVDRDVP